MKLTKRVKKYFGALILFSQLFSLLAPLTALAGPTGISGSDTKNALETVGTQANRLKTAGSSGVDESSGAFTYSYPIKVPKGKFGLELSLSINYNSQNTENSIVGYGQSLQLPYIERTTRYGVDKIYTKNDFISSVGGELISAPNSTNQYIQKIDDGSYQLYTFSNDVWTLTDRSGNTYTYGTTLDSRLSNDAGNKIQKYYLTSVKDTLGNRLQYFYEKKNGFVYPKEISYTQDRASTASNRIVFEREIRNDAEVSYKTGFRVTMDDRIKSIKMYTDNVLVGQVDLGYILGQNSVRSLLSTISESRLGTDGVMTTLPVTQFNYTNSPHITRGASVNSPGYAYVDINGDANPETVSLTDGVTNTGISWTMLDVNGDYWTDQYYSLPQGVCQYSCPATGMFRLNVNGAMTAIPFSNNSTLPATAWYNIYSQIIPSPNISVTDLNGDGLQDVAGDTIKLNNGGSFTPSSFSGTYDALVDINNDGLPDRISGTEVYLNNGSSWNTASDTKYVIPTGLSQYWYAPNGGKFDMGVRFLDINRDGLIDIIRSFSSNVTANPNYTTAGNFNDVYLNTGSGWTKVTNVTLSGYAVSYTSTSVTNMEFLDTNATGGSDVDRQDMLKTVTNQLGGKTDITYKNSAQGNNPKLPINVLVVDKIQETESKTGLTETTQYNFENGKMYFDVGNIYDRRFAGFGKVTTQKGNQKSIKYFHQGDGDDQTLNEKGDSFYNIGKTYHEELWGKNSLGVDTKYSESWNIYGVYQWGGQTYSYLKQNANTTFDDLGNKLSKGISYEYDLAARLPIKVTDYASVNYDSITGIISDIGEDGVVTKNIYNTKRPQKLLSTEVSDMNGKFLDKKVYFYDELPFGYIERGLLTESRDYSGPNVFVRTTNVYNDLGLLQQTVDNNGNTTSYTYDANNNPVTVTNTLGQTTVNETNKWLGVVTKTTDPNGKVVQTIYDGFGKVKSISGTTPSGAVQVLSTKSYTYGTGLSEVTNIYKDGIVYKTQTNNYDTFGRQVANIETVGASSKEVDSRYDNLGQLVSTTYPYDANGILGSYNSAIDTKYTYDSLGRAITITQGDNTSYISYLVNGKKISDNSTTGHLKSYTYDARDKIISVAERNGGSTYETRYSWNLLGNLIGITDAEGNVRNFKYDGEGRLLRQEDLHKPTDNTFGVYTYSYDALGNLIGKTDPALNKFSYSYDALYRPISENAAGKVSNYTYDVCSFGKGKICSISNSDYTQTLTYKPTGDIATETKVINGEQNGKTFTNTYVYNSLGQTTSIVLPDNSVLNYTYDLNGKQKSVSLTSADGKTINFVSDAKYNIDGTIKDVTYGNETKSCYNYSTGNGSANTAPRLSDIYSFVGTDCANAGKTNPKNLFVESLIYNKEGMIVGKSNHYANDTGDIVSNFAYDELNRLTSTSVLENNLTKTNLINYSPIGNILNSDSISYSYATTQNVNPNAPTSIGNKNLTYDPNGNVLTDGKNLYNWTEKNTMSKQENEKSISQYVYDLAGERIKEIVKVKGSATETSQFSVNENVYNVAAQEATQKTDTYISENSFNELNTANLLSENKVSMLFALAYETGYPQRACLPKVGAITDPNCQKAEAEKFVGAYLLSKYKINLTNTTLEEMYGVYMGQLLIGNSIGDYAKNPTGSYLAKVNVLPVNTSTLSTTTIANEIVGKTNNLLYGYVYKENKIASLFGNPRLLAKESFADMNTYGLSYTSLIIYDRLIAYSFDPYASCNSLSGDALNNCRKTILVKYLYAIIKYEKGIEISAYTLDDMAEVILGNLSVPNNSDEYYITEIKNLNTNNTNSTSQLASSNGQYISNSIGCGVGYFSGFVSGSSFQSTSRCVSTFTIPPELVSRAKEINKVEIENFSASENINALKVYLNISNPYQTFPRYAIASDINTGINDSFANSNIDYKVGSVLNLDITGAILPWAKGQTSGTGLRFVSDYQNNNQNGIQILTTGNVLKVTFRRDVDQQLRAFATPLLVNPRDNSVDTNVLNVLARVDKDYVSGGNVIVSKDTYSEIASTGITTTDQVKSLFAQNEKLQKDDTLAAVYNYINTTYGKVLTREALEELWLVWSGQMSMPTEVGQYDYAVATTTRVYYQKAAWNFYSENSNGVKTQNTCVANYTSNCYMNIDGIDKPYAKTESFVVTLSGSGANPSPLKADAITDLPLSPLSGAKVTGAPVVATFTNVPISLDLTTFYKAYENKDYLKNGFLITGTNFTADNLSLPFSNTHYVDIKFSPKFTVFDRSKLSNLSVVPGVYSMRSLVSDNFIQTPMLVSVDTKRELASVGINQKSDIYPYITILGTVTDTTKINATNKIAVLTNIFNNVKSSKNISFTREALEEIFYILNNKLYFVAPVAGSSDLGADDFNRADSSLIGGTWTDSADSGDNMKISGNTLNMKWTNSGTYQFKSVTQNIAQQNDLKISYKWKTDGGSVDGYYPYIGLRSLGGNDMSSSYGVALLYIPQNGSLYADIMSAGSLLKETKIFTITKIATNYNVEIIIDKSNYVEFRMWEDGTARPATAMAIWNNNGSVWNPTSTGNKIIVGTMSGSSAPNSVSSYVDDLKVTKLTVDPNAPVAVSYATFDRTAFPGLEPLLDVSSLNDSNRKNNISYSLLPDQIKIVSDETKGELGIVGINSRQQILDIMAKTPTVLKDSKMHFFKEYIKENKGFVLSREALEEVYLIYSEKEVFLVSDADQNKTISKTLDTTDTTFSLKQMPDNTVVTACTDSATKYCELSVTVPTMSGYNLKNAVLKFSGLDNTVPVTVGGVKILENPINGTISLNNYPNISQKYVVSYPYPNPDPVNGAKGTYTLGGLSLFATYSVPNLKMDRLNFADLKDTSTYDTLKASYDKELASLNFVNSAPSISTTTIAQVSTDTAIELASANLKTVQDVKSLFANASSTWNKESKLYFVWKKVRDVSVIELTRAALEELWNVNAGTETIWTGTTTSAVAPTTITERYTIDKTTNSPASPYFWGAYYNASPQCLVLGVNGKQSECLFNFKIPTKDSTATVTSATLSYNYKNSAPVANTVRFGFPTETFNNTKLLSLDQTDPNSISINQDTNTSPRYTQNLTALVQKIVDNKRRGNTYNYDLALYNLSDGGGYGNTIFYVPNDGYNGIYGVQDPYLDVTWTIQGTQTVTAPPVFDRSTLSTYVANSDMDSLLTAYASSTNTSTSTLSTPNTTTPSFCNSILVDCGLSLTSATTTIATSNSGTQVTDSTSNCNINNPYNYPFTIGGNCIATFILPNGSTTNDGTIKIYNTIAKNLTTWTSNATNSSNDQVYTKYYPSAYYEYDTRGVVTINIPFNGKVVGTYKYDSNTGSTLPPEVSYIHNSYNGTPVLLTDGNASTTQVIKRDVWGEILNNNYNENSQVPTSFGLTNHKWDEQSELTYAHARFLSNKNKVWLSHDPFSIENFSSDIWLNNPQMQNSYSYSTNDPVNKMDPDGKLTIVVPGTFYGDGWKTTSNPLFLASMNTFGEIPIFINDPSKWNGGNNNEDRQTAGNYIADIINGHKFAEGEQLNIICHSHGCNASRAAISMMTTDKKVDNFVTLGAPPRPDYYTDMSKVKNMVEVYSRYDWTQIIAGNTIQIKGVIGAWVNQAMGAKTIYSGKDKVYFDGGLLGRYENKNNAVDATVFTTFSTSPSKAHGELWSVASVWNERVQYLVDRPKK